MCSQSDLREGRVYEARVQAVLQEVHFIRVEILDNVGRLHRTTAFALSLYGGLFGLALHNQDSAILVAAPVITFMFAFMWLTCQTHLDASSSYMKREIEQRKWPELIGFRNGTLSTPLFRRCWVSWQHFFDRDIPSVREDCITVGSIWLFGLGGLVAGTRSPTIAETPVAGPIMGASALILGASLVALIHQLRNGSFRRRREEHAKARRRDVEVVG